MKNLFRLGGLLAAACSFSFSPAAPLSVKLPTAQSAASFLRAAAPTTAALRGPLTTVPRHQQQMARYDVKYYKLDLALENTSVAVAGSVRMQARNGGAALDSLAFELYPTYTIDSVVVQGRRAPGWRRVNGDVSAKLAVAVPAGQLFNALIYYHGTAPSERPDRALHSSSNAASGFNVLYSFSQPLEAYEWFPCKQVVSDKADSSDVWVTTTLPNKVGSNGVLQRVTPLPGGKARYEWKSRHPIAYYLISVAVAPYVEYTNYAHPAGSPAIPIVSYLYNQAAIDEARPQLDLVPAMLENFASLVGPYPFANEKYGHCLVPAEPGDALENQTMTTLGSFENPLLLAHELFHHWFGNNVTCASWQDIWLNEGFADYGAYLTAAATSPDDARTLLDGAAELVMSEPGGTMRVSDTLNARRILDQRLSYKKGALVIHMLRYLLNDDTKFFRALRTYQSTYAGRAARTRDLQRIFEAEAGRSLQYFFDQWYQGEGYPTFTVRWNQSGNTLYLQSSETVSMPAVTPFFDTEVDYKLSFADGTSQIVRLRQGQPVSGYSLAVAGTVTGLEVDPQQWILNGEGTVTRDPALVLGTRGGAAAARLSVYPVPCREYLRLVDVPARSLQAEVWDATGRVVLRQPLSAGADRLVTAGLPAGVYHLRLLDGQGQVSQARFIRE
ncbi:T9SS type A sorting domain-containing protein [Hymenobacter sp. BT664]|uniref:Aminopeptidase N n=1 Tax=Hymenobacter montanus TaxID=2771359 RepID=A0A927BGY1_9BACT|nr:M1 family metallopeptidase [Hymenobacter montanus]MBD2769863.1 T9SS type A sorting domain-containing protein [Hymenobacter montanus]